MRMMRLEGCLACYDLDEGALVDVDFQVKIFNRFRYHLYERERQSPHWLSRRHDCGWDLTSTARSFFLERRTQHGTAQHDTRSIHVKFAGTVYNFLPSY